MELFFVTIPTIIGCILLAFSMLVTGLLFLSPRTSGGKLPQLRVRRLTIIVTDDWLNYTLVADLFAFCALTLTALMADTEPAWRRFYFLVIYLLIKGVWAFSAKEKPKTK